jgi:hypothetical protein
MRRLALVTAILVAGTAQAEVRELEGEEMNTAYVTGISIATEPEGAAFAEDDTDLREQADLADDGIDLADTAITIENAQMPEANPALEELLAGISQDRHQRKLAGRVITDTATGAQFDVDLDRLSNRTGIEFAPLPQVDSVTDLVELFPSGTGYQFEFKPREF